MLYCVCCGERIEFVLSCILVLGCIGMWEFIRVLFKSRCFVVVEQLRGF